METFFVGSLTVEIVEEPARSLPAARKAEIVRECIPVARRAFRNEGVLASDIIGHALKVPAAIFVRDNDRRIVAFSSAVTEQLGGHTILYLEGTAVEPEYQAAGLYGLLNGLRILHGVEKEPNADWLLSTRTQSPVVFRNMVKNYGLSPHPEYGADEDFKDAARDFAKVVWAKYSDFVSNEFLYDVDTQVQRRAYGKIDKETKKEQGFCMYGDDIPWCDEKTFTGAALDLHRAINSFFKDGSKIDLSNGDAVVLLGRLDVKAAQKDLVSSLGRLNRDNQVLASRFSVELQ
jgi:hypothetical protein